MHLLDVGAPTGPHVWGDTTLLRGFLPPGATLPFGPLWFLGVYLVVVAMAPWLIGLHRRFRWWVPALMVTGAVAADVLGFIAGFDLLRWCNVAFVLLLPHQLGFFYARRHVRAAVQGGVVGDDRGRARAADAADDPAVLVSCSATRASDGSRGSATYPKSLLGTDVERVSNAYPPTVCFLLGRHLDDRSRDAAAPVRCSGGCSGGVRGRRRSPSTA